VLDFLFVFSFKLEHTGHKQYEQLLGLVIRSKCSG